MSPHLLPLAAFVIVAAAIDLHSRRIPNWLNLAAAITGLSASVFVAGLPGLVDSGLGIAAGLLMLLPFFAFRVLGAGDVKMLAAVGSFAGPTGALMCGLYGMIAGGLLALAVMLAGRRRKAAVENLRLMFTGLLLRMQGATGPDADLRGNSAARLPYGVALAAGTLTWIYLQSSAR
ncbi:A24 family peptidase [Quisquiliibacterium transsilvanicum]|uniref:Prepilin peptidase CpaA n=1 Tax=Quisquiliibacterium transsilvanicum TaxID=1549638 RepID=A0A7W8M7Y3_9BURK|nr:A24 family peptidase [Quisquiliibacterium transsilvanicum]MBB5271062.1 prepilin peptidase CpaA [Quisquiliibacterium transsilvanicum]